MNDPTAPLADELVRRAAGLAPDRRAMLGIVGEPGAGKSTLAEALRAGLVSRGIPTALVGMDAFHLANSALEDNGLVEVKGAPETFDVDGYLALLRRLRAPTDRVIWAPEFRREIEDAVAAAVPVRPEVRIVITEGNYLLLDGPWRGVRDMLDECWFVTVPTELRQHRLAARHQFYGRSEAMAWQRTLGSDERNARTVAATQHLADLVIPLGAS
ncbi:MAG TPA: nucleoside/nucleotide kinase family protein [Pseudonocardia sp.]